MSQCAALAHVKSEASYCNHDRLRPGVQRLLIGVTALGSQAAADPLDTRGRLP
jgi:hypothetical protein